MVWSANAYKSTARDRIYEFKIAVDEAQKSYPVIPQVEGHGVPIVETEELDQIGRYINELVSHVSTLIKSLINDLRNRYRIDNRNLGSVCERIQKELNDLKLACEGFEEKLNGSGITGPKLSHYKIMGHTHITRLRELTTEYGRVLEQRRSKEKKKNEREQKYGFKIEDLEKGEPGSAAPPSTTQELSRIYDISRVEGARHVQKAIYEVSQLFQKVNSLVSEQGELVDSIYADAESASWNLREGEGQLKKYLKSISSTNALILKVFAIILGFVVFFILFVM